MIWPTNVAATGKRILVVEDEYVIIESLTHDLQCAGAVVLGPVRR